MAAILDQPNDFLLQKVLGFLPVRDLSNAAAVCKRFKHNAIQVFAAKHSKLDILELIEKGWPKQWYRVRWMTEKFLESAEQLFARFGSVIKALRLQGTGADGEGMDENELLSLVKTYCTALKELTLYELGRDNNFTSDLFPLFARLERLTLFGNSDECMLSDSFVLLLTACHNVKHLSVNDLPSSVWTNHKFPKLETLDISNDSEFDSAEFGEFLISHDALRTLRYKNDSIASDVFPMISKALAKLETFRCIFDEMWDEDDEEDERIIEENIVQLSKLKLLKRLTFTCDQTSMQLLINGFHKENTPIEHLEIVDCKIDNELIAALSELPSLKTLTFTECKMAVDTQTMNVRLNRLDGVIIKDNDEMVRPDQQSDILNILHDDCIIKIFKFLPLSDLCKAADVCQRFQQNAQTVFKLHHTCISTDAIIQPYNVDMALAEQFFRNFGFFIRQLTIEGCYSLIDDETMLFYATKYCISITFEELTLIRMRIKGPMRWIFPLLDMFGKLPKLELNSCWLDQEFGRFLTICHIPTIQVYCPSHFDPTNWMMHSFWNLQCLILVDVSISGSDMEEFIKLNRHLQSLVIHQSNLSSNIFKIVTRHMTRLRQFCFAGTNPKDRKTRRNVVRLAKCEFLSRLSLNCTSVSVKHLIDEFIKEDTPIAELNIHFGTVNVDVIERLAQLRSLKSFTIRRVKMEKVSLVDLVKKLPDLDELHIDIMGIDVKEIIKMLPHAQNLSKMTIGSERSNVQIGIVEYKAILEIVKSREKPLKFCLTVNGEHRRVHVPVNLLEANGYWLKLDNEINENLGSNISDSESDAGDSDSEELESDEDSDEEALESGEGSDEEALESNESNKEPDDDIAMEH